MSDRQDEDKYVQLMNSFNREYRNFALHAEYQMIL